MVAKILIKEETRQDKYVISRLRQVLKREVGRAGWQGVSRDIANANGGKGSITVGRKTLPKIVSENQFREVKLSISQLIALDKYLVQCGAGSLFARDRSLIDSLAESVSIAFYVNSKFHGTLNTDAVSAWDLRAISGLMSTQLAQRNVRIIEVDSAADWRRGWSQTSEGANVSVGSPIASEATTETLIRMLGYRVTPKTNQQKLPFFIVGRRGDSVALSGFVRKKLDAIARNQDGAEKITRENRALVFGNEVLACDDNTDYALLLAQRDSESGQVSMVLAGLSGIGTYELAEIVRAGGPSIDLYEHEKGRKHPPILAAIYQLRMKTKRPTQRNKPIEREVLGTSLFRGPLFLHFSDGKWRPELGGG